MDPMELWRQWYETGTKTWSNVLGGKRENYMDPYGLYRQWFSSLDDLQKRMSGSARTSPTASPFAAMMQNNPMMALMNPATAMQGSTTQTPAEAPATAATMGTAEAQNLWKQWFEAVSDSWQKASALGTEAINLAPRWAEMLEQIRHNFLSAEGFPTDPLQFATRWYNATSGPLSEFVGDLLEHEDILEPSSKLLQHYASFYRVFRRDSEEYLKALSIPVRSDVARVAGLVVALEDKIDRLDEAFEDFEYGYAKPATAESLEAVEERIESLEQTLQRIEGGAPTTDTVSGLENRLDDVEAKLDRLLAAFESTAQNGRVETASQEGTSQAEGSAVRATAAAQRKARELGMDLAGIEGTGMNGQITVDDVRRQSAREEGEG
jgi:pyruvate/2-oxoglutarate dehydrogenase complex dihydrolipoamide acyltransferase (E2) component